MIKIIDKKECTGCKACKDVCSINSINFEIDNEGFWYPIVDEKNCVNCGLCEKVCPVINKDRVLEFGQKQPVVYGGFHKNIAIRFDSTSGGVFSALANEMYKENGYVSGAVFSDNFTVKNYISNNKRDLTKLRSSKYVQSDAEGLYKEIKKILESGEKVLACGSPCQMAALRTFLNKDYENLVIVDFLCRANNSPKVYKKYLDFLEEKYNSKIVSIKPKNKDHGWRSLARKVTFDNNEVYYGEGEVDPYRRAYHLNFIERPSCYDCKFKGFPRCADISLGDFWGINKLEKSLDKDLGTSLILLNTEKGINFFNKISNKIEFKQFRIEDAIPANKTALLTGAKEPEFDRESFYKDLDVMPFDKVADKYFPLIEKSLTLKQCIKKLLKFIYFSKNPGNLFRFLKYNTFRKNTSSSIKKDSYFKVLSYCALDIHKSAKIMIKNGTFTFGVKRNKKSKMETRLLLEKNAVLQIDGKNFIKNGSDIQVFKNGFLRMGAGATNQGLQIICSEKIWIGDHTHIGRDVQIRDNNGGHSIIQAGYTDTAPVIIGNNVWICSNVVIMKGVTIGDGAVIAANSVVTSNIPPKCIASGNPAQVVTEKIIWRP